MTTQMTLFDYNTLDAETRIVVQQRTGEIKGLMKRAAQDIIDIGQKLIEVKERLGHGHFTGWLRAEFAWTDRTAQRFISVAESFKTDNLSDLNIGASALYLLASAPESARAEALERASAGETITHKTAQGIVNGHKEGTWILDNPATMPASMHPDPLMRGSLPFDATTDDVWGADTSDEGWDEPLTPYEEQMMQRYQERHTQPQSAVSVVHEAAASVEWYTPAAYLDAAHAVMGGIDTDPASNDKAQQRVRAGTYYTIDDDGFHKPWRGRVWLNPPYGVENGKAVAGKWAARLIEQYDAGITTEAIVLVNAVIDSKWFNIFWRFPICFTDHRIRFELPPDAAQGANTSPVIGSAIVYLGSNVAAFVREFSQFGAVVARLHEYDGQVYSEVEHAANAA